MVGDWGQGASTENLISTRTVAYSPQGAIIALGKLQVKATENFLNNTAYVEVFGSATIDSPFLDSIGLENQAVSSTTTMYRRKSTEVTRYVVDPQELDSLFFVHGNFTSTAQNSAEYNDGLIAENSEDPYSTDFTNHNALDYYIVQTLDELFELAKDSLHEVGVVTETNVYGYSGCYYKCVVEQTWDYFEVESATNSLASIKADGTIVVSSSQDYRYIYKEDGYITTNQIRTDTSQQEYSLYDELMRLYNQIKDSIMTFFNEVTWW